MNNNPAEWRIPPMGEDGCHGDSHAFTPPPADGVWHELICQCGELGAKAIKAPDTAYAMLDPVKR